MGKFTAVRGGLWEEAPLVAAAAGGGPIMWSVSGWRRDGGASLWTPPINHAEKQRESEGGRHFTWSGLKVGLMCWYDQVSLFESYAFGYKWIRPPPQLFLFFFSVCLFFKWNCCLSILIYLQVIHKPGDEPTAAETNRNECLWDFNFTGLLFNIQLFHRLLLFYGKLWHLYDRQRFNLITRSLLIKLPNNAVKINLPVILNRKVLLPCLRIAVITSARSTLLTFDTLEILKWLYL